jgi:transposase
MPDGELGLAPSERKELRDRVRSRTLPAEDVRRARLILLLAHGESYLMIRQLLGCNPNYISRWKGRFEAERLAGLYSRHRGRTVEKRTPALEARILEWTRRPAADGSTHWSSRKLARHLGVSHMMVARVWQRAGLKPHRIERYMASDDPNFELKAADIIGLYVKPPQHAAVFCVDEKTAIQALDRLDPVLPLSPGRLERHGFEYYRHGTLSLYAALNTKSGEVVGKTAAHHTSQEFVAFLADLVANQPRGKETILSRTTCRRIRPGGLSNSSRLTPSCTSTTRRPTPLGSTRSKTGSPRSSAMSLPAASSPRSRTSRAS